MLRLILLVSLISTAFAGGGGAEKSWLTDWLLPHPGLFFWTVLTFLVVFQLQDPTKKKGQV